MQVDEEAASYDPTSAEKDFDARQILRFRHAQLKGNKSR
jgi:hypothetical protein